MRIYCKPRPISLVLNATVVLLVLLFGAPLTAGELRLLDIEKVTMEGSRIKAYRDPYFPDYTTGSGGEEWAYGAASNFNFCLICYGDLKLFWDNRVHMTATDVQVRHVGWFWELGTTIIPKKLDIFYRHHSEHCMECQDSETRNYPLLDEYVIRFNFYERK